MRANQDNACALEVCFFDRTDRFNFHSGLQLIIALTAVGTVLHDVANIAFSIQVPMQFHRRHTLKIDSHQIDSDRPFLQRHRRVFQQCAMVKRKMLATIAAAVSPNKAIFPND